MGKTLLLKAQIRQRTGSRYAAKVRKSGRIPAIVYGHKLQPVAISLDTHNLIEALHHGHRLMDVQIGNTKQKTIIKDLQYDHLGKNIIHVDLMRVDVTERIKVTVPVEIKGVAKAAQEGGIIEEHTDHLEVECRATDIPESIVVSVKQMKVGDNLHARDIELPEGVELVSDPEALILACSMVAQAEVAEEMEQEAPAAPEVISKAKEAGQGPAEQGQA